MSKSLQHRIPSNQRIDERDDAIVPIRGRGLTKSRRLQKAHAVRCVVLCVVRVLAAIGHHDPLGIINVEVVARKINCVPAWGAHSGTSAVLIDHAHIGDDRERTDNRRQCPCFIVEQPAGFVDRAQIPICGSDEHKWYVAFAGRDC